MNKVAVKLNEQITLSVIPDAQHEFLLDTKQVAEGYGIAESTLRRHLQGHRDELNEGEHYVFPAVHFLNDGKTPVKKTFWTKAGVVKLGLFIKSERAKAFREWVVALVLRQETKTAVKSKPITKLPDAPKRKHNRLSQERLLDIMRDVCEIKDDELRMRISRKLMD